jgi:hypothetical protein
VTPGTHRAFFGDCATVFIPNSTDGISRPKGPVLEWAQLVTLAIACGLFAAQVKPTNPEVVAHQMGAAHAPCCITPDYRPSPGAQRLR